MSQESLFDQGGQADRKCCQQYDPCQYAERRSAVGYDASKPVTQAQASQDNPDQAGPDKDRSAQVWPQHPGADNLEDHDHGSADEYYDFEEVFFQLRKSLMM